MVENKAPKVFERAEKNGKGGKGGRYWNASEEPRKVFYFSKGSQSAKARHACEIKSRKIGTRLKEEGK